MDIFNRFSLQDFLAYLFPGVVCTLGILAILLLPHLAGILTNVSFDLLTSVLLFVWSYCIGLMLSSLAAPLVERLQKRRGFDDPRQAMPFPEMEKEIRLAYQSVFHLNAQAEIKWNATHFLLCRALVEDTMPIAAQQIHLQNGLRKFRENMIPVVLLWGVAGLVWAGWLLANTDIVEGTLLAVLSVILAIWLSRALSNGVFGNRRREVSKTYAAFLAGYAAGIFPNKEPGKGAS